MNRREFLGCMPASLAAWAAEKTILVHEHILVDFAGADKVGPGRYDPEEVFRVARPKIEEVAKLCCRRLQECTPNYLGRDPKLLARLSDATGVEIWTNTGLYAANNHRHLPEFAKSESAGQLAKRWIQEAKESVDGVQPRFIKIGVNKAPLHEWDRKVVEAAAITSKETGLTIAAHTGDGAAAVEELEIVTAAKLAPSKLVWVHAQSEKNHTIHEKLARAGAWVEFDGINVKSREWHLECVMFMAARNLLHRTLISQDSGWYRVGEPGGGEYRGYTYIYSDFLPTLKPEWARMLMVSNPVKAFGG